MRNFIILAVAVAIPATASAQGLSTTVQIGQGNIAATAQMPSGSMAGAVTLQVGHGNNAVIMQSGPNNIAAIGQWGDGHSQTIVQTGPNQAYGSVQMTGPDSRFNRSFTYGTSNGYASTTVRVEVTD